ncbi:endonuclease-reverse transcriptase domain-containing protein [Hirsutella rhossiliensis]|uniref:Endonuclease-reverse transcriptase domain-containing protein n=1 Tax=Hirsutella rhossiliensis TaxID=111463 RepID=A0A9P8SEK3_9HYPO|nr:endonuclease-reverse transcriptase domain-containing protein [Hirsutella rhossiliensis]KAH0958475.1 endonuclease-reverse transcriptase domain-containing protein [Hirsutella rhossiliensis]
MQRVLETLGKMGSEMVELKHRVSEQNDMIRKLNATVYKQSTIIQGQEDLIRGLEVQVQESKEEFQRKSDEHDAELKRGHRDLQREVAAVKEQLAQLTQNLNASGEVTLSSGTRATFADIARTLPASPPTSLSSVAVPRKQQTASDPLHCTIDTSRVSESKKNNAQIGSIRQAIETEMRAMNGQETWRDEAELQMVKDAAQKTAVEGSRVMRDQLYPVRVDNANRTAILTRKISWLSKRESGKAYGSMVVYVTKKRDAERLLEGYYFDLAGESATTYVFEPRTGPIQCFNCQEIGHKAYSCKKQRTCGKCANVGHHHRECTAIEPKCVPLMLESLRILQLNAHKSDVVQQSLMNDEDLKDFAALAISEPHARNIDGKVVTSPTGHHNWTKMIPTCVRDGLWPIRSMLWIRSDLEAEQVPVPSADLTAAVLRLEGREVMVVSVYVQGKNDEALTNAMELLRDVIDRFRNGTGRRTDVVLAGDFNRHDLLWGGDEVSASRQGEGQPIIDLMDDFGLSSLLPRGTKTWQRSDEESTIDLVLASAELADELTSCGEQAEELLSTFFPPLPTRIEPEGERPQREEIAMPDLTLQEIEEKVMAAKPWESACSSLREGVVPHQWRTAKIIPLRKPDKGDYTLAKAWRPISLLSTLGKILEAVVAERISYAVEAQGLLPANHFGARKRRSADQALVLLQERIYKAWRTGRVLSLISFDVKGAYNGVCKERMLERMKARGIPNLVQRRISNNGGSIAFVDDYSAWVTGPTAESNRDEKTSFIHFTRIAERDSDLPLIIKGNDEHIARAAAKGLAAAMCLKRLKMASPRMARQLAQRIGAQAVIGGFRTVATAVADAEAGVQSFRERHAQAAAKFWIRMRTLPKTHPLTSLRLKLNRRYASPMQKLASAMGRIDTKRLEVIHEFALAPWDERVQATYEADRVEVLKSDDPEDITIATSSSQRKGKVGLGGVVRDASRDSADEVLASYSVTLGSSDEQNAYTAGLEAIATALSHRAATATVWSVHDTGDIRIC